MAGEDIENHLRPIHDAPLDPRFNVALLGRSQIRIENEQVRARLGQPLPDFFELPAPDQRRRVQALPALHHRFRNDRSRAPGQLGKFQERVFRTGNTFNGPARRDFLADSDQDGAFSGTSRGNR